MHTTFWKASGEALPAVNEVVFNHNGDYSGDVIIRSYTVDDDLIAEMTVPVAALEEFIKGVVGGKLIGLLEENGFA